MYCFHVHLKWRAKKDHEHELKGKGSATLFRVVPGEDSGRIQIRETSVSIQTNGLFSV
ncbi:MAG: hypothetical protein BMS9Abin11_0826 [Gammaproteobacteria bacterium]|nr:MAG: hypothetical protein BMS9Abin11_0826 [Gammaproteobacteria bacterium]